MNSIPGFQALLLLYCSVSVLLWGKKKINITTTYFFLENPPQSSLQVSL